MKVFSLFLILITALVLEGTGVRHGREISFWIVIALPITAFFLFRGKKVPRDIEIAYLIFLVLSAISAIFSSDPLLSLKFLLLYTASGFAFLFALNNKQILKTWLIPITLVISIFFCLYSIFVVNFVARTSLLEPNSGYQWVYPLFASHNHLGDFLMLPLIICLYTLLTRKLSILLTIRYLLLTIFFLPFFLFSFARGSYIVLIFCAGSLMYYLIKHKYRNSIFPILLLLLSSFLCLIFFTVTIFAKPDAPSSNLSLNLLTNNYSKNKPYIGYRDVYVRYAMLSIIEKPLLGVGPGNFVSASKKYMVNSQLWTQTAHNIFLEILTENGIGAFIVFLYIFYLISRRLDRSLYFFLALALFLNFQIDYTYRIFSIFLLFSLLLGLSFKNDETSHSSHSQ